jgi:3-oxoacyl-[acyl-carrier-protein] synthase-3
MSGSSNARNQTPPYRPGWRNDCRSCFGAASRALGNAGITAAELTVVVATTTPDETFLRRHQYPSKTRHGARSSFDIQAVCSGSSTRSFGRCHNFIRSGQANTVLVIGAETMSRILD